MSVADTANLVVKLSLGGNFNQQLKAAQSGLGKFNAAVTNSSTRAYKAGQQIGTGIKNAARIAVVALTGLAGLLVLSIKEGQEAAKTQLIYAKAISNSGKVSAAYVGILNKQQTALMNLAGVDDELIKAEQTRLVQFGLTGKQVAKLTPLILDAAKATGKDLLTVTIAVGKAVLGNTAGLAKLGIVLPPVSKKLKGAAKEAAIFANVTDTLNKRFGGTTKALSGSFDVRLAALRENLANIREEAGQRLLPVLTRIVDVVGRKVVPAFGAFMDRILPGVIGGLDKIVTALEGGGAEQGISAIFNTIKSVAPALQQAAEVTGRVVKTAVDLFKQLPPGLQTLLVTGLAVNKLTGGLLTNIAGGALDLFGKMRGSTPANPLFVSDVGGGIAGAAKGAGLAGLAALATSIAAAAGIVIVGGAAANAIDPSAVGPGRETLFNRDPRRFNAAGQVVRNSVPSDRGGTKGLPFGGHSPFDTSNTAGAVGAIAGAGARLSAAAARLMGAADALKQAKIDVPNILKGIRARSAAKFGGSGLGEGAVNATFNRNLSRLASNAVHGSGNIARRLARLQQLAAQADAHGGRASRAVAAAIRRQQAVLKASIDRQKTKVTVNVTTQTSTYLNGRLMDANTGRYKTTIVGSRGTFAEFG